MKLQVLFLLALSVVVTRLPAQLRLALNGGGNSSGDLCPSVPCVPDTLDLPAAFPTVQINVAAGGLLPTFLLLSSTPAACVPVPGFDGALQVQPPGVVILLNLAWGHFPHAPCAAWIGFDILQLPAGLPPGLTFRAQLLGAAPDWGFSNAVDVTIQ